MKPRHIPVFDGHNDALTRLWLSDYPDPVHAFIHERLVGHLDLKRCQEAGFIGGMFAIFLPPYSYVQQHHSNKLFDQNASDFTQQQIEQICLEQLDLAHQLAQYSKNIKICTSVQDIQDCRAEKKLAIVLHMEGAEALQQNPDLLDVFYERGLRSIGPLWNRPSRFGHGLNAKFPHSPDTGAGLTSDGKDFIRRCANKKMVIDVSHMNEKAFWNTVDILQQPIVATHSNSHALCPQARNLTDPQLKAIRESKGMVGVNFDVAFLRSDGQRNADTSIDVILEHLEYLMDHLGEEHVGFGSDFDGALIGTELEDVTGLHRLIERMQQRGYSKTLIENICLNNWVRVLNRIFGQ
ncbi:MULTISPECIES: dipeptidase [Acinetobacter]|jgi:membrane dipeptidase|uniref:Dipeptidase n=1 Tax=Acinetobacter pittii TaxID=48296 RepID=A0AAE9S759_ACIPI|nr:MULTISPECIES: dipeptidase [Acinetobacter calcoaceticus/baumannii complex]AZP29411.1 peptidase [Acinetobacter pittii]EXC30176.1 membrane dipeptidase [Acinetobacter sp. 809848]EXE24788.1 membrane dipeptidase family protein [Acinetobacter sp. 907131]EXS12754.1 membrane dipeptidase family protein [Acinetobacter sp. 883425]MBK0411303.1 dipeptidase [Acinetobacter pittii]